MKPKYQYARDGTLKTAKRLGSRWRQGMRFRLVKRDGWRCMWCKEPLNDDARRENPFYATIEHIKPLSDGGGNEIENLGLACRPCNSGRAAKRRIEP